jgi:CDP-6-deoxy-D-xylo-4-hexulose-3-dehydrase
MFKWPLNTSSFTLLDRIKICLFFLNFKNFWTQGKYVKKFEEKFAKFVESKYAVFVANGSVANTLLAMYLKDKIKDRKKKEIIFPSTTWTTSISPFLREGFTPKFIDISLDDFCLDLSLTEKYLKKNHYKVAAILCVSLIGQVPDIKKLQYLEKKYNVRILLDNCENTLGLYNNKNISSYFTSTTSTYFGHQLQSVEGGFVFTNSKEEYDYFLMARNHGMTRSLSVYGINTKPYQNPDVNSLFDFNIIGNNFRNTDIHAFIGLLDFNRVKGYIKKRHAIYNQIIELLGKNNLVLPKEFLERTAVPFCFPVLSKNKNFIDKILSFCKKNKIETRPIISGNLLRQTCYKKYGKYLDYPNSEFLHKNGFYFGIYPSITDKQINILKNIYEI